MPCGRNARISIEERNDHGHVGPANGYHQHDPKQRSNAYQDPERQRRGRICHQPGTQAQADQHQYYVYHMPARQQDGAFFEQSLKFAKRDSAPGEGDGADQRSARRRQRKLEIYRFDKSSPEGFFQGGSHRQRRGAASEAVEDGDHLWDRGHRGAVGHDRADQGSHHYASYDDFEADDALVQKGNHNRQEHARRPQ